MESPPATPGGEIIQLPQVFLSAAEEIFIVSRYKALRLRCLQQELEAFSSIYEEESKFTTEAWVQRITNPSTKTFIAVSYGSEYDGSECIFSKLSCEWIGVCTLLGPEQLYSNQSDPEGALWAFAQPRPIPKKEHKPKEKSQRTLSYCAVSMFVLRDQRRQGVGLKLIDAVIEGAGKQAEELLVSSAYLTIFFDIDNHRARHLYGKWGFTIMDDIEDFPDKVGRTITTGWGWLLL